jgi:hypothetical protein
VKIRLDGLLLAAVCGLGHLATVVVLVGCRRVLARGGEGGIARLGETRGRRRRVVCLEGWGVCGDVGVLIGGAFVELGSELA